MKEMLRTLREDIANAFVAVLPVSAAVLLLATFLLPVPLGAVAMFLAGVLLAATGMGAFVRGMGLVPKPGGQKRSGAMGFLSFMGPVLAVMLLGALCNPGEGETLALAQVQTVRGVAGRFAAAMPAFGRSVLMVLLPVCAVFLLYQLDTLQHSWKDMLKCVAGAALAFGGSVLLLAGIGAGFLPVTRLLSGQLAASPLEWLTLSLGLLAGCYIAVALAGAAGISGPWKTRDKQSPGREQDDPAEYRQARAQ